VFPPDKAVLSAIAAVLLLLQAGYLALRAARGPDDRLAVGESLALSYGLGVGLVTLQMLAYSLAGIRFTLVRVVLPWAVVWPLYLFLVRRRAVPPEPAAGRPFARRLSPAALLLLAPVAIVCLAMLVRSTFMPVWVWDAWAIWDIKARAFHLHGGVVPFLSDSYYALTHLDYPLLVPLAGTFVYLTVGHPHGIVQIVSVLFYASTLAIVFALLRRLGAGQALAAALTAGLGFLPNYLQWSQHFQSEGPLVFYVIAFVCYLYLFDRDGRRSHLLVAALSAAFLTQTRAEGWILVVPGLLLLGTRVLTAQDVAARKTAGVSLGIFAAICGAVLIPWLLLKSVAGVSGGVSQVSVGKIVASLHLLPDAVVPMLQWTTDVSYMGEYTLLFPLALVFVFMNWRRYVRMSGESFLLATALISIVPPLILLITLPYWLWLSVNAMGRYLLVLSAIAYLLFAIHTVEAARSGPPGGARALLLKVSAAVVAALLIISLPALVSKIRAAPISWDFRVGAQEWHHPGDRAARVPTTQSGAGPFDNGTTIVTPVVRLDADLIRTIRVTAKGQPGKAVRLTLGWKRLSGEYLREQTTTVQATWSGAFQTIVFSPPWRGMVEEFALSIDGGPGVVVRSVETEPRWLSLSGLMLRGERWNLPAFVALVLLFLAAAGALGSRDGVQRALAAGFAAIVLVFWVVPDVSPVLSVPVQGFDYARPIGLTGKVLDYWNRLGPLEPGQRLEALETEAGRPRFAPVIRETSQRCGSRGDVIVLAAPDNMDAQVGGYVFQRSRYLLFPSRVLMAYNGADVARLLRSNAPIAALIAYGVQPPADLANGDIFRDGSGNAVRCDPNLLESARPG
jgi:hypothetical protein